MPAERPRRAEKKKAKNKNINNKQRVSKRAAFLVILFIVIAFGAAVLGLFNWQILRSEEMRSAALDQSLASTTLSASRGTIYDRSGKVLAQSAQVWTIACDPNTLDDDKTALLATGLSQILGLDYSELLDQLDSDVQYTVIKRKVETGEKELIEDYVDNMDIGSGMIYEEDYKRYYPYSTLASVVIGYTGTDNTGLAGLELYYDDELSGTSGRMVSSKNAANGDMPFEYETLIEAEDGYDLVLTIDETVQSIVEKYLNEGVKKYSVQNGAVAILMDVNDGSIIAMAQSDSPDCNNPDEITSESANLLLSTLTGEELNDAYIDAYYDQWTNKAVSDTYMPGSVFKMVTASMALDSGTIDEKTEYVCEGSYIPYENEEPINCWVSPDAHGTETVWEGICNSCNPFFMQVGKAMGSSVFFKYFEAFGMTEITGIDLPGEILGTYYDEDDLGPVELATETFGQNFTITPIQMITACCAIANGGYLVQPHVVDKVLDGDGNIVSSGNTDAKRQVISEETAELVTAILEQNATSGTGSNGYVSGYHVAGKTGTSEKITEYTEALSKLGEDEDEDSVVLQYIASYCGFAPADNPQYALLVFYDEPDPTTASGGAMAAPVFSQIMSEVLPYLGVEKDTSETGEASTTAYAPRLTGMTVAEAREALADTDLYLTVFDEEYSEDDVITSQVPSLGTELASDGSIYVYIATEIKEKDLVTVPDFAGVDLANCQFMAMIDDLQIYIDGNASDDSAIAQYQDIEAGEKVKPGTVISITFMSSGSSTRN